MPNINIDLTLNNAKAVKSFQEVHGQAAQLAKDFQPVAKQVTASEKAFESLGKKVADTIRNFKVLKATNVSGEIGQAQVAVDKLTKEFDALNKLGLEPTEEQLITLEAALKGASGELTGLSKEIKKQSKSVKELGDSLTIAGSAFAQLRSGGIAGLLQGLDTIQDSYGLLKKSFREKLPAIGGGGASLLAGLTIVGTAIAAIFNTVLEGIKSRFTATFSGIGQTTSETFAIFIVAVTKGIFGISEIIDRAKELPDAFSRGFDLEKLNQYAAKLSNVANLYHAKINNELILARQNIQSGTEAFDVQIASLKSIGSATQDYLEFQKIALAAEVEAAKQNVVNKVIIGNINDIQEARNKLTAAEVALLDKKTELRDQEFQTDLQIRDTRQKEFAVSVQTINATREDSINQKKFNQEFVFSLEEQFALLQAQNAERKKQLKSEIALIEAETNNINAAEKGAQVAEKRVPLNEIDRQERLAILGLIQKEIKNTEAQYATERARLEFVANNSRDIFGNRIAAVEKLGAIEGNLAQLELDRIDQYAEKQKEIGKELTQEEKNRREEVRAKIIEVQQNTNQRILELTLELIQNQFDLTTAGNQRAADVRLNQLETEFDNAQTLAEKARDRLKELNTGIRATNEVTDLASVIFTNPLVKDTSASFAEIRKSAKAASDAVTDAFKIDQRKIDDDFDTTRISILANIDKLQKEIIAELNKGGGGNDVKITKDASEIATQEQALENANTKRILATNNAIKQNKKAQLEISADAFAAQQKLIQSYLTIATSSVGIINTIFDALKSASAAEVALLDKSIAKQKERVDVIKAALKEGGDAALEFNARVLQAEEDRQAALEDKRKQELEKQQAFTQAQLVLNALLAISNTIAQSTAFGGPLGPVIAAVNVGLILAQLAAGFAAARASAGSAIAEQGGSVEGLISGKRHKDGGEWGFVPPAKKWINFEGGEFIHSRKVTKELGWEPEFEAIRRQGLTPQEYVAQRVTDIRLPILRQDVRASIANPISTFKMESELKEVRQLLSEIAKNSRPIKGQFRDVSKK